MVFDTVVNAVFNETSACFFLQASGGCGKTHLYRKIDSDLRSRGLRVVNVALTGIASTLLHDGSTAHHRFFLPMNADENSSSAMYMESGPARFLESASLIIFDESTMADRHIYNCIDILLKNIMQNQMPFGGKVILLGGDWKQLLHVVTGQSTEVASDITLLNSSLWKHFKVLTLSKNIRAKTDDQFAKFLEETGVGRYKGERRPIVQINKPGVMMQSQAELLKDIYEGKLDNEEYLFNSCVLCTAHKHAEYVNSIVLAHVRGEKRVYDTAREGLGKQMPSEFFCTNMESGMPPFEFISSRAKKTLDGEKQIVLVNEVNYKVIEAMNRAIANSTASDLSSHPPPSPPPPTPPLIPTQPHPELSSSILDLSRFVRPVRRIQSSVEGVSLPIHHYVRFSNSNIRMGFTNEQPESEEIEPTLNPQPRIPTRPTAGAARKSVTPHPIVPPVPSHHWLYLTNIPRTDCFLNAALQFLRRARSIGDYIEMERNLLDNVPGDDAWRAPLMLLNFLKQNGRKSVRKLRNLLPLIAPLEVNFKTPQQDAVEAIIAIFQYIILDTADQCTVTYSTRNKCRDVQRCQWRQDRPVGGSVNYVKVTQHNQVRDLEQLLSNEWCDENAEVEPRHCSACCDCCMRGHNDRTCAYKQKKRLYQQQFRWTFDGTGEYAIIGFNIITGHRRLDWNLSPDCNLDCMRLMGSDWRAVALIEHIGQAGENWSSGHHITYTRDENYGRWYVHYDDKEPEPVPPPNNKKGICAILFQKI